MCIINIVLLFNLIEEYLHHTKPSIRLDVHFDISAFDKKLILTGHDVPTKYSLS